MASQTSRSKRGLWFKFGRFISGLTIACFFLPFFGVSCEGMEVITVSGADMVGGCKPGGMLADAEEQKAKRGKHDDGADMEMKGGVKIDSVPREPLAMVALALALVAFGLAWVRTRGGMIGAAAVSIACFGALIGLWLKVGSDLSRDVDKASASKGGGKDMGSQMMKDTKIEAGSRWGLYLTCLTLIGGAGLAFAASREPEGTENLPPGPRPV